MRLARTANLMFLAFIGVAFGHRSFLVADDDATYVPRFTVEGESLEAGLQVRSVELIVDRSTPVLPADWSVNLERLDLSSDKSTTLARWIERPECAFPKLRTVSISLRHIDNDDQIATAIGQFLRRHALVQKFVIHGDVGSVGDKSPKSSFLKKIDGTALAHLNHLTLHNCRVNGALPTLLATCKLKNLEINFSGLPQSSPLTAFAFDQIDLEAVHRQNDLQSLTLVGCIAKTSNLDFLSQRENPPALRLIFCEVDSLIPFRHCQSIEFEGCSYESTALSVLEGFDRLHSFRSIRCGYKGSDEATKSIRLPSTLKQFSLNTDDLSSPSDRKLIAAASRIPDCTVAIDIDNLQPDRVANLEGVRRLTFRCGIPSKDSLDRLHSLPNLKQLRVAIEDCSADYLKSIVSLPHLERLHIHYSGRLNDTTVFNELIENYKIKDLILSGLPPTTVDFVLRQCPAIARLRIELSEVRHADIEQLQLLKELQEISFLYCDLSKADVEGLFSLPVAKIGVLFSEQLFVNDGIFDYLSRLRQANKPNRSVVLAVDGIDRQQLARLSQVDLIDNLICTGNLQFRDVKPTKSRLFKIGTIGNMPLLSFWNE